MGGFLLHLLTQADSVVFGRSEQWGGGYLCSKNTCLSDIPAIFLHVQQWSHDLAHVKSQSHSAQPILSTEPWEFFSCPGAQQLPYLGPFMHARAQTFDIATIAYQAEKYNHTRLSPTEMASLRDGHLTFISQSIS